MNERKEATNQTESPKTLAQARAALRKLPGIENYVTDWDKRKESDQELSNMVLEATKELNAKAGIEWATYLYGWSEKEAQAFFLHPQRQPFSSKINFANEKKERKEELIVIGTFLKHRYENDKTKYAANSKELAASRKTLASFVEVSTRNIFTKSATEYTDRFEGINPDDRKAGTIKPNNEFETLINRITKEVAEINSVSFDDLYRDVVKASDGGILNTIQTYLWNNKGDDTTREVLEKIYLARSQDEEYGKEKLKLLWEIEKLRMAMGIDIELMLEIDGYPNSETIEKNLIDYLEDEIDHKRIRHFVDQEAPKYLADLDRGIPLNQLALLKSRAETIELQDYPLSESDAAAQFESIQKDIHKLHPLSKNDTSTYYWDAPTRLGSSGRGYYVNYENIEGDEVKLVLLNGRRTKQWLRSGAGHEAGHQIRQEIARHAIAATFLDESDRYVPENVDEKIAFIVEADVNSIWPERKPFIDKDEKKEDLYYYSLANVLMYRRLAQFSLTQIEVRKKMQQLWEHGNHDDLKSNTITSLFTSLQEKRADWYKIGISFDFKTLITREGYDISILERNDGTGYLADQIWTTESELENKQKNTTTTKAPSHDQAFINRFGKGWSKTKDGKIILHALMVHSSENHDLSTYDLFVETANIEEWENRFTSWGIINQMFEEN